MTSDPATYPPRLSIGPREWALLTLLALLWAGSFLFQKIAVAELPPFTIVFCRLAIGAAALWTLVWSTGAPGLRGWRIWAITAAMALLNNVVPFSLVVWAQAQMPIGLAAILNAMTPFFSVLVAPLWGSDEPFNLRRVCGIALGVAGVSVMIGLGAVTHAGSNLVPELAVLLATLSYAVSGFFGRRFIPAGQPPLTTGAGQLAAGVVLLLPAVLLLDRPWTLPAPDPAVVLVVVALGLASTGLAYVIFFTLLRSAGATNTMVVTLLIPVAAIILGVTVLDETLEPRHLIGFGILAVGLAVLDGRLLAVLRPRPK